MLTVYEDDTIRIALVDSHVRGPRFPKELDGNDAFKRIPGRRILTAIYHHSAGGFYEGIEAVHRISKFCIAAPEYAMEADGTSFKFDRRGRKIVVGGGRGWPGNPYTYIIPARPVTEAGRLVIYKLWDDDWSTWHTGGLYNASGVGICIGGWYASRHDLLSGVEKTQAWARPTDEAMVCADRLADWIMDRYQLQLGPDTLKCHAELGKPACPGGYIENWVREKRGEEPIINPVPGHEDPRPLTTVRDVQAALVELGYKPGPVDGAMGPFTQGAIKAFQHVERLRPDGVMGPITRTALRLALARGR